MIDLTDRQALAARKHAIKALRALGVRNLTDYEPHTVDWPTLNSHGKIILAEARSSLDRVKDTSSETELADFELAHEALLVAHDAIEHEKNTRSKIGNRAARAHGHDPNIPGPAGSFARAGDGCFIGTDLEQARSAIATYVRSDDRSVIHAMSETRMGMSAGDDPSGGYFVIPALSSSITSRLFNQNPVRKLARNVTINSGDSFEEPLDLDQPDAVWVSEMAARPQTETPKLGKLSIPLDEIYCLAPVTQRLLDASYMDLGGWLESKIVDKFGRTEGLAFVSGTGNGKPRGFLSLSTDTAIDTVRDNAKLQHVVSGDANLVTADSLRNLYWSMRAPHRKNSTWVMASATANAIDRLKNTVGEYLWRDGMTAGAPPSLLGLPVEFCEDMPTVSAGTFPIALGDWQRGYTVVDMTGLRILRDPFMSKPNILFYAWKRVGGDVSNTDAIKLLKISA
jgi:HK97 family phage major capsid protein